METIILEIKSSEGGQDAKNLVRELTDIYRKFCQKTDIDFQIREERSGFIKL